jgi:hypothetical protein
MYLYHLSVLFHQAKDNGGREIDDAETLALERERKTESKAL